MTQLTNRIAYSVEDLPHGESLHIRTEDPRGPESDPSPSLTSKLPSTRPSVNRTHHFRHGATVAQTDAPP